MKQKPSPFHSQFRRCFARLLYCFASFIKLHNAVPKQISAYSTRAAASPRMYMKASPTSTDYAAAASIHYTGLRPRRSTGGIQDHFYHFQKRARTFCGLEMAENCSAAYARERITICIFPPHWTTHSLNFNVSSTTNDCSPLNAVRGGFTRANGVSGKVSCQCMHGRR